MSFMYDHPNHYGDGSDRSSIIIFEAYNKRQKYELVRYKNIEIQCITMKPSDDCRQNLSHFYSRGEFPRKWGYSDGQVESPEFQLFDDFIKNLVQLKDSEYNLPSSINAMEALKWPTRYFSTFVFRFCSQNHQPSNFTKNVEATILLQSVGKVMPLEALIIRTHRKIVREAAILGMPTEVFTGLNLIKEIAAIQCVRLMNACKHDALWFGQNRLNVLVRVFRERIESWCPSILGNGKWNPIPAPELVQLLGKKSAA